MSTLKSSNDHLTLNADGTSKDIKFQADGVEKASISSAGLFTSTTIDATKLTGALPSLDVTATADLDVNFKVGSSDGNVRLNLLNSAGVANGRILYDTDDNNLQIKVNGSEKLRILSGGGITFNGDTATANALDDYEEGVYIPTIVGTSGGSWTTSTTYKYIAYTKIGRLVHLQGYIVVTGESSPSGNIRMSLPFTPSTGLSGDAANAAITVSWRDHGGSNLYNMTGSVSASGIQFVAVSAGGGGNWIDSGDIDSSFDMRIGGCYIAG